MRYCGNCSYPLPDGSDSCPRCGAAGERRIAGSKRALMILLSVFIAPAGIVAGSVYMAKDLAEYRAFGRMMLIISLVSITLTIICCCSSYGTMLNFIDAGSF